MTPEVRTPARAGTTPPGAPPAEPAPPADPVARLRTILLGREREQLRRLEQRLDDPEALSPVVTQALTRSVRRDPQPLADALFPVMGPAIRRAISQALAGMLQSLNQALESTFSLQGLAWRWEAIRTGRPFAEVVLRHSLVYRVEQVFLVHRESGILLQHLTAPSVDAQDAGMVAGMLTAIQDFARDSFRVSQQEMLEQLQVGELTVWVEQGSRALLAAVFRGHAPVEFRTELQATLEELEGEHAAELDGFQGDTMPFGRSRPRLEALLREARQVRPRRAHWQAWVLLVAVLGLAGFLLLPRYRAARHFADYVRRLRATPGLVVTQAGRDGGRFLVQGLRDPQAPDPATLRAAAGVDTSALTERWEPYVALLPEFMARRAARALRPPASLTLRMAGDTLVARGAAPAAWYRDAGRLALALPGVGAWREERVAARDIPALAPLVQAVELERLQFPVGSAGLDSTAVRGAARIARAVARLDSAAAALGFGVTLFLVGSADEQGDEALNDQLRRARADALAAILTEVIPARVTLLRLLEPAVGSAATEEERARRRAVYVRVQVAEPDPVADTVRTR